MHCSIIFLLSLLLFSFLLFPLLCSALLCVLVFVFSLLICAVPCSEVLCSAVLCRAVPCRVVNRRASSAVRLVSDHQSQSTRPGVCASSSSTRSFGVNSESGSSLMRPQDRNEKSIKYACACAGQQLAALLGTASRGQGCCKRLEKSSIIIS